MDDFKNGIVDNENVVYENDNSIEENNNGNWNVIERKILNGVMEDLYLINYDRFGSHSLHFSGEDKTGGKIKSWYYCNFFPKIFDSKGNLITKSKFIKMGLENKKFFGSLCINLFKNVSDDVQPVWRITAIKVGKIIGESTHEQSKVVNPFI